MCPGFGTPDREIQPPVEIDPALPYEPVDCFDCFANGRPVPMVVPVRTLLSQLL